MHQQNPDMIPFTEIAGEKLNDEQRFYLEGLFAGLRNRGLTFADVEPDPAKATSPAIPPDLIFEERVKRELHPLDAYPQLLDHAARNTAPDKENTFRFKWHGLFYLAPTKEGFMCRLRIPGGSVKTFQWREVASIARELTTGYVQITTRANLQIRVIEPKNAPEVLRRIQGVGLHSRGAGADNIRNITCNPTAGIDPHEWIDTLPLARELGQYIINHREFYDLPRKFNIALDGGGRISSVEDTNDIGLTAVRVLAREASDVDPSRDSKSIVTDQIAPGVYYRVALGGATGHKAFARDLGVLVRPEEALPVVAALVRVFIRHGARDNRKKARLKHLLETWPLEQYLAETEMLLGYRLLKAPADTGKATVSDTDGVESRPAPPHSHLGVHPQKQAGLNYVGVAVPVGQITPKQMLRLADLADHYGSGEIRLTVWQNLIIPNVPDAWVETLKKALVKMGLPSTQSALRGGFVACTGNSYCKYASTDTKGHAVELMEYLDKRFELDRPINVHLTGCPHSCAQHYMGDIGLLGAKVKVSGESVEGYHVFVGGGFGDRQAVGRQVFQGVSFESLKPTLEKMLRGYLRHREPGETFQSFANRHEVGRLQELFSQEE